MRETDNDIILRLEKRDEIGIDKAQEKYGRYIRKIAYNILGDMNDCEECLSDVLLSLWNSIPPQKPADLRSYIAMITRRSAVDIMRKRGRDKRKITEYSISLDELGDALFDPATPETETEAKILAEAIEKWLANIPEEHKTVFLQRYYFSRTLREISKDTNMGMPKLKSMLWRLRQSLRGFLEKENLI